MHASVYEVGYNANDLEVSVALGEEINSPETPRALHNLATMRYASGDVIAAADLGRRAVAAAERFGVAPIWHFSRALQQLYEYRLGNWDNALEAIDRFLEEQTGALYAESSARLARSWIRVNRGDTAGALEDSARSLETSRSAADPQALFPALTTRAFVLRAVGREEAAEEVADEWAKLWPGGDRLFFATPGEVAACLIELLGPDRMRNILRASGPRSTLWREAAIALLDEDLTAALAMYERAGDATDVAVVRLGLAKRLLEADRRAEADVELQRALGFFRLVRATRYVREGEALLAAAS